MFLEYLCFSDHRLILRGSITCNEEVIISMERVDRTVWDQTLEYFVVRYGTSRLVSPPQDREVGVSFIPTRDTVLCS